MRSFVRGIARRCFRELFLRRNRGRISIGADCSIPFESFRAHVRDLKIGDYVRLGDRVLLYGEVFSLGDHFYCGDDVAITGGFASFSVGTFSGFASRVSVVLGKGHHRPQSLANVPFGHIPCFDSAEWIKHFDYRGESTTLCEVGSDVWVGLGSIILPNVRIGDGAVISAGSVVTRDVPPYAVVGGHPAQVIAFRFKQSLIEELLELKWWDWPIDKINRNKALFTRTLTTLTSLEGVEIVA